MKLSKDWLVNNWSFLSSRFHKSAKSLAELARNPEATSKGVFFGKERFFDNNFLYSSVTRTGNRRIMLRPFISADLPVSCNAIYIDPKLYIFNDNEQITGLKSSFEVPFFLVY